MLGLMEEKWDVAIILDACRFDSFLSYKKEYLDSGRVEKRKGASCTTEWCKLVLKDKYPDTVYVSGNPWINSMTAWDGFDPRSKFKKIIDVWDFGWDEKRGTVPPENVTKEAIKARDEYYSEKMIVHYLQPHYPYLSLQEKIGLNMFFGNKTRTKNQNHFSILKRFFNQVLEDIFGKTKVWKFRNLLGVKPNHVEEFLWNKYSAEELKNFYEDNLARVMDEVMNIMDEFNDFIVITSDHGEAFGEYGDFFHPLGTNNPFVRQVPYWTPE